MNHVSENWCVWWRVYELYFLNLQCGRFLLDLRIIFPKSAGLVAGFVRGLLADLRIIIHESAGWCVCKS